jgi:hypothetical protein
MSDWTRLSNERQGPSMKDREYIIDAALKLIAVAIIFAVIGGLFL